MIDMATRNYTVDDTANDKVDAVKLDDELRGLSLTVAYNGMRTKGDLTVAESTVTVYFDAEPDSTDDAALNTTVAAHDGVPEAEKGTIIQLASGTMYEATSFDAGSITWTEVT